MSLSVRRFGVVVLGGLILVSAATRPTAGQQPTAKPSGVLPPPANPNVFDITPTLMALS